MYWKMQSMCFARARDCPHVTARRQWEQGTEMLSRAQAVAVWVNPVCSSCWGTAVQLSALSVEENCAGISCPPCFKGFVVSTRAVGGSAQFRHWQKQHLNLGTLFHFLSFPPRSWGKCWASLLQVTSVPKLSPVSVRMRLTLDFALVSLQGEIPWAWLQHHYLWSPKQGCRDSAPFCWWKLWTRTGLNFPSDKGRQRNRALKYPKCLWLAKVGQGGFRKAFSFWKSEVAASQRRTPAPALPFRWPQPEPGGKGEAVLKSYASWP